MLTSRSYCHIYSFEKRTDENVAASLGEPRDSLLGAL